MGAGGPLPFGRRDSEPAVAVIADRTKPDPARLRSGTFEDVGVDSLNVVQAHGGPPFAPLPSAAPPRRRRPLGGALNPVVHVGFHSDRYTIAADKTHRKHAIIDQVNADLKG